jgi:hypothetical protein
MRRTFEPYAAMLGILSSVSLFDAYVAIEQRQWGLLKALPFIWLLYSPLVFINRRYPSILAGRSDSTDCLRHARCHPVYERN